MALETFDFGDGPVPAHRHPNGCGVVANTADVEETAYVGVDARVYGNASVYGESLVYGNAIVRGNAEVYGNASISGIEPVSHGSHTGTPHATVASQDCTDTDADEKGPA